MQIGTKTLPGEMPRHRVLRGWEGKDHGDSNCVSPPESASPSLASYTENLALVLVQQAPYLQSHSSSKL